MIGMISAKLRYPMMVPAKAIPLPPMLPADRRMLDCAACPQMIAGIAARKGTNVTERMPHTKLAMARPEVGGGNAEGILCNGGGAAGAFCGKDGTDASAMPGKEDSGTQSARPSDHARSAS